MDRATWKALLKFAFHPASRGWDILGLGLSGAGAIALFILRHPLWGTLLLVGVLSALFVIASYRLQEKLERARIRQNYLDVLGRQLTLGRHLLDSLERATDPAEEALARGVRDEETLLALPSSKEAEDAGNWEMKVGSLLSQKGYSLRALFENDRGLTPADPPEKISTMLANSWKRLDLRIRRLHEILEELNRHDATK